MPENDDLFPANGPRSASKFETLIALDNEWRKKHQGNFVTMGSAVILSSEPTAVDALRVGNQVATEKGVTLDFLALVNREAQKAAKISHNERYGLDEDRPDFG